MKNNESEEMYLETILLLQRRLSHVRSIDVAEEMNYSRASISRAMGILQNKGFIRIDAKGAIHFTEEGKRRAEDVYERHCVLTRLFVNTGADERLAELNACRIEHYVTDELFAILKEYVKKVSV